MRSTRAGFAPTWAAPVRRARCPGVPTRPCSWRRSPTAGRRADCSATGGKSTGEVSRRGVQRTQRAAGSSVIRALKGRLGVRRVLKDGGRGVFQDAPGAEPALQRTDRGGFGAVYGRATSYASVL